MERPQDNLSYEQIIRNFILHVLGNFTYRYMATTLNPEVEIKEMDKGFFGGISFENSPVQMVNCQDPKAKEGIKGMFQGLPRGVRPTVMYQLACRIQDLNPQGTSTLEVLAMINWNFPNHDLDPEKMTLKKGKIQFEEIKEMRMRLPQLLEEICSIF